MVLPPLPKREWINTESLRFCFEGCDALVKDMGLVNQPYKIVDSAGAVLALGSIAKDGRLPRIMAEENQRLRIEIGSPAWEKLKDVPATPSQEQEKIESAETLEGEDDYLFEDDPYIRQIAMNENQATLSNEQLVELVGKVQGEE